MAAEAAGHTDTDLARRCPNRCAGSAESRLRWHRRVAGIPAPERTGDPGAGARSESGQRRVTRLSRAGTQRFETQTYAGGRSNPAWRRNAGDGERVKLRAGGAA